SVAEALDGVEAGSSAGGEVAGKDGDQGQEADRYGGNERRHLRDADELLDRQQSQQLDHAERDGEAESRAHADDEERLQEELPQNVRTAGADGALDADLPRSLPHYPLHDVRHPDAAHRERKAADDALEDVEPDE